EPNELVVETRPEEARHNDSANHQNAAHGRRALFHTLQFSQAVDFRRSSDRLFDFQCLQLCDYEISKNQRGQKCGDRRSNSPEGNVKKNVEPDELPTQVMEVVHHGELPSCRILIAESLDYFLRARDATAFDQYEISRLGNFA